MGKPDLTDRLIPACPPLRLPTPTVERFAFGGQGGVLRAAPRDDVRQQCNGSAAITQIMFYESQVAGAGQGDGMVVAQHPAEGVVSALEQLAGAGEVAQVRQCRG